MHSTVADQVDLRITIRQQHRGTHSNGAGAAEYIDFLVHKAGLVDLANPVFHTGYQGRGSGDRSARVGKHADLKRRDHGRPGPFEHIDCQTKIPAADKYTGPLHPFRAAGENGVLCQ